MTKDKAHNIGGEVRSSRPIAISNRESQIIKIDKEQFNTQKTMEKEHLYLDYKKTQPDEHFRDSGLHLQGLIANAAATPTKKPKENKTLESMHHNHPGLSKRNSLPNKDAFVSGGSRQIQAQRHDYGQLHSQTVETDNQGASLQRKLNANIRQSATSDYYNYEHQAFKVAESPSSITQNKQLLRLNYNYNEKRDEGRVKDILDEPLVSGLQLKQSNLERKAQQEQYQAITQSLDTEQKSAQKNAKIVFPTISLNHNAINLPIQSNDYNNNQLRINVQRQEHSPTPWDKNERGNSNAQHLQKGSPAQRRSETFKAGHNLGSQGQVVTSSQEYSKVSGDPQFRSSYLNSKRLSALRQQNQIKSEIKTLKQQASEIEKNGIHYAGGGINQVQFQSPNSLPLNHHKMQKIQFSSDQTKVGSSSVVLGKSINTSQSAQTGKIGHPNPHTATQNLSEFSQYCDSLNIKKIKKHEGLIQAGDKIIKRDQIQFAQSSNHKGYKQNLLNEGQDNSSTPLVEKQSPRRGINGFTGSEYDNTGAYNSQFASRRQSKQGHQVNADYNNAIMSQGAAYEKKNWHTRALLSQSAAHNLNLNSSIPFSSQDSPLKQGMSPAVKHSETELKKSVLQAEQNSLQTKDNIKETYGQKTTLQEGARINNIGFQQQNSHLIYSNNVGSIENSVQDGLQGLGYQQHGIRNSQSQELINKPQVQINRNQQQDQTGPQIQGTNGLFSIQKTQSGLDPNSMFKNEQRQKRVEEQRQYKQNDSMFQPFSPINHGQTKSIKEATGSELSLLCQFLAQTLRNERLQNQAPIPPQYHLDQNVVQQDLLQKAAAGLVPKEILQQIVKSEPPSMTGVSPRQAKADPLGYWSALYQASAQASAMRGSPGKPRQQKNPLQIVIDPSQNQIENQALPGRGPFDNFTVEQLAQVRSLIGRRDNQELLREVSKALQNHELLDMQTQQSQPVNYTINQRIAHQKQYDRQRMFDFYKAIRIEDINDQAKSRMQAIALAPPSNPFKLRFAVLPGNNSRLIKIAMQKRDKFWEETTNSDPHFHFKWQPVSSGIKFDSVGKEIDLEFHPCQKQLVNHYEGHSCLSEKSKLFSNMSRYASDKLNENVFDFMPLQFYVECDLSKQRQFSKNMVQFMNAYYALDDIKKRTKRYYNKIDGIADDKDRDNEDEGEPVMEIKPEKDILDDQYIFKHYYQNQIGKIKQHKREEREEREAFQEIMQHRAVKNKAQESEKEAANASGKEKSNSVDHKQTQLKMLKKHFFRQSMPFCHFSGHNMWILKATKLNQGQGIHVCNTLPQIKALIQKYCEGFSKKESESFKPEKELQALRPEPLAETTPQKSSTRKGHSKGAKPARGRSENKIQNSVKLTESTGRTRGDSAKERGDPENRSPVSAKEPPGSADGKKRSPKVDQRDAKQYIMEEDIIDENDQESQNDASDEEEEKPLSLTKQARSGRMKYFKNTNKDLRDKSQRAAAHQPVTNTIIKEGEPKYKHNSFIIQKYIERPLLIKQRKFDIRIWVFVNPQGDVYYCQKGYLRTSSTKYAIDPEDPDNRFVHLTNNAVQKYAVSFGQHEDGNILSLNQFQQYVDQLQLGRKYSVADELIPNMKKQIARTLFATRKTIDPHRAQHAQHGKFFELFGYDFMIDEDFNTWLIEVNTNPSLSESSKYLCELVPRMIDDLIKITVDKEFYDYYCFIASQTGMSVDQVNENLKIPSTKVRDFPDDENIWEKFISLNNKQQRKEDKQKWLQPLTLNSQYLFNIKGREFRIKKYIKPPPLEQKSTPVTNYTEAKTAIDSQVSVAQEDSEVINNAQAGN